MQKTRSKQVGFSFIEIMVVVVIIGILASIIVPQIMSRPDEARIVKAKQDILAIENALNLYKLDSGFYPSTDQGLSALVKKPETDPKPLNWKRYLKAIPKDPWGKAYYYLHPGIHNEIDIFTNGADGQPGGEGINAQIGNWETEDTSETQS